MQDTIAVRADEQFDVDAVAIYLRERLPEMGDGPLEVRQFPSGASNLTYLLRAGDWEAVLRRPPLGPVAPGAHEMGREYRVLARLHPVFPLAPRPYLYCEDAGLIGAPFYLMERRRGLVLDREWPAGWPPSAESGGAISRATVDALVDLHAVDYAAAGLADLGRPEGYLERQVRGWIGRYERARTAEIPGVAEIGRWLAEHLPPSPPPAIVHNDYKLNNLMLAPERPDRIVAVLDWEMCTLGDPLVDLGNLLVYWREPGDEATLGDGLASVTSLPGFANRDDLLERYARTSGRDLSAMPYYLAFSYYRVAVIAQQIYHRWHLGQTRDERFRSFEELARRLVALALDTATSTRSSA
jgi:aminoglycoside phosphotransferase (APT) family kinase protein